MGLLTEMQRVKIDKLCAKAGHMDGAGIPGENMGDGPISKALKETFDSCFSPDEIPGHVDSYAPEASRGSVPADCSRPERTACPANTKNEPRRTASAAPWRLRFRPPGPAAPGPGSMSRSALETSTAADRRRPLPRPDRQRPRPTVSVLDGITLNEGCAIMPKSKNARADQARDLYLGGRKQVDVAKELNVPPGTVRRWKCTYKWDEIQKIDDCGRVGPCKSKLVFDLIKSGWKQVEIAEALGVDPGVVWH